MSFGSQIPGVLHDFDPYNPALARCACQHALRLQIYRVQTPIAADGVQVVYYFKAARLLVTSDLFW